MVISISIYVHTQLQLVLTFHFTAKECVLFISFLLCLTFFESFLDSLPLRFFRLYLSGLISCFSNQSKHFQSCIYFRLARLDIAFYITAQLR